MQGKFSIFLALLLIQGIYSQCSEGTWTNTRGVSAEKGKCNVCLPACQTCTSATACTAIKSTFAGFTSPTTLFCSSSSVAGTTVYGYNKNTDSCEFCKEGCLNCAIDYDFCTKCKGGWDYDRSKRQCLRATLGLAATILGLTALFLVLVVITCVCACKL